jgi:hypothetical protein
LSPTPPPAAPGEPRIKAPGKLVTGLALFLSGCGVVLVTGGVLMWLNDIVPFRTNDNLRSFISPDGKHQAVLFRRTVKGRDAYTTHVAILGAGEALPNKSGRAFIAEGEPFIIVRWTGNRQLVIDDPDGTKVILRASQIGDIRISER